MHVTVRANAGIAKQIPGAADLVAPLQQDEVTIRAIPLKAHRGANAGEARANNNDVKRLCVHFFHGGDINRRIHTLFLTRSCRQLGSKSS